MKPKLLIADDEPLTRKMMARALAGHYTCLTAGDGEEALALVKGNPDLAVLLTDYKMPGMNGVTLISEAKRVLPSLSAILITAFGEIDLAVEAMKQGADDFLTKPITDLAALEVRIGKALKNKEFEHEATAQPQLTAETIRGFTGKAPAMEKLYRLIRKVAPTEATVIIEGPSGTGKELTARAIHTLSRRASGPFVAVECASLPPTLLESELFGAVKGAFTGALDRVGCFEAANGGTLFLDEIGEITLETQVKLLRVLETRSFQRVGESVTRTSDFRLVAATNRNLRKLVAEGKFREDLYYRLNVIDLHTPALREHPEDIALLVRRFIGEFAAANGSTVKGIDDKALKALESYSWPGNVRELRNVVEKMVVLASGETLAQDDLPPNVTEPPPAPHSAAGDSAPAAATSLAELEKEQILSALDLCGGNKSKAAERLGISRRTLHRKLNEWGMGAE